MASGQRPIYWDSCVWLSYINGYPGRLPVLETLLADSRTRLADIELVTSTIAQTEVAFALAEWESHTLDPEVEAKIDSLWTDRRAITLVEYHTAVAKEARDLIRLGIEHQWQLKPLDAIHLATARWLGVDEFHTYDTKLPRYSDQVGFPIMEPYVATGKAAVAQPKLMLFDEASLEDEEG